MKKKGTVSDEIDVQIQHQIQRILYPLKGKIKKVYSDGHVDVTTDIGDLDYVKLIGYTEKGVNGLIVFVDGDINSPVCISLNIENILNIINELRED